MLYRLKRVNCGWYFNDPVTQRYNHSDEVGDTMKANDILYLHSEKNSIGRPVYRHLNTGKYISGIEYSLEKIE